MKKLMTFGNALEVLKAGGGVSREGWNGKGMFIFMRPVDQITIYSIVNHIKSLPPVVKEFFDSIDDKSNPGEEGLQKISFTPYLCMKAADNSIVNGWLASQTDMTAEDWSEVSFKTA